MEIELLSLDKDERTLRFKLKDSNPAFANALRRILVMEVPVLAIDEIIILENTSPLYDEIIAHRLGLMPVTTPVGLFNLRSECVCEGHGCTQCEVSLTMDFEGPNTAEITTVKATELVPELEDVRPVEPELPILRLSMGQKVTLQAIARLGIGKTHAKWQSGICSYKYEPVITIDNEVNFAWEDVVANCPPKILYTDDDGNLQVTDPLDCILCGLCMEKVPNEGGIRVDTTGKEFVFTLSTLGHMPATQLLAEGLKVLREKADDMRVRVYELDVPTEPTPSPSA